MKARNRLFVLCALGAGLAARCDSDSPTAAPEDQFRDHSALGVELAASNPNAIVAVGSTLIVSEVSEFGDRIGGLEVLELSADGNSISSRGVVIGEAALGGDVNSIAMADEDRGYAIISDENFANHVVPFDLATGDVGPRLEGLSTGFMQSLVVDGDRLIVADPGTFSPPQGAGLVIFDTGTQEHVAGPISTGLPPVSIAILGDTGSGIFVATSDFTTGSTAFLAPDADAADTDLLTIHADAVVRFFDGKVYIISRLNADNILVLDASNLTAPLIQFSVGNGSNPQDIEVISADKAYVTRLARAELVIVDPRNGAELGTIDLSGFADADGLPEMTHMARIGSRIYVLVQRLDTNDPLFAPTGTSYIVVIDTDTDTIVDMD